jgi:oligoribonuclease
MPQTSHQTQKANRLIWIDLEMTGLNPESDRIIEIATIVTDSELNILSEGPNLAIHQDPALIGGMDDWNQKQHGGSGLIERVLSSKITDSDAEQQTLAFLKQYVDKKTSPMCGNTICQDRRFLAKYMPELEAYFHYRHLDVSTVKELAKRWAPSLFEAHKKESAHRALEDIKQSIQELQYYRNCFFQLGDDLAKN